MKFPFKFVLTRSPLFFIILGLWLLSLAVVIVSYCIIKRKRCLPSVPETIQEVIVPLLQEQTINWITLPCGFLFDEKYGDLKYQGEVCVRLKDNLLRLFRSFIKAEEYKLTYEDICVQVLGRSVKKEATKSDRDTVAKNISRLREVLNEISMIQIKTLRNAGYQMIFSANQTEQTS